MGVSFSVIAGMLLYGIFAKLLVTQKMSARLATILFVGGYVIVFPLLISSLLGTVTQLLTVSFILGVVVQLLVTSIVYYKLESIDDDAFLTLIGWFIGGAIGIFFVVPSIVQYIPTSF